MYILYTTSKNAVTAYLPGQTIQTD